MPAKAKELVRPANAAYMKPVHRRAGRDRGPECAALSNPSIE
jgi:hypothetical protein